MLHANPQLPLPLPDTPPSATVSINGRCTLRRADGLCVVTVAGLPMQHWAVGDRMGEAHAMVSLVLNGYADQNEVARAFGCSTRTLRRHQRRFESGGMNTLGRAPCRPTGTPALPSPWVRTAVGLKNAGLGVRTIAERLRVSVGAVSKWLRRMGGVQAPPRQPEAAPDPSTVAKGSGQNGSLDSDPEHRLLDRLLARLGKLEWTISDCESPNKPVFCIEDVSVVVLVPDELLPEPLLVCDERCQEPVNSGSMAPSVNVML